MKLTVKDYTDAKAAAEKHWGLPTPLTVIEKQIVADKEGVTFNRVHSKWSFEEYFPHRMEVTTAMLPKPMRAEGYAPWRLYRCEFCEDCGLICTCGKSTDPEEPEGALVCEFAKFMNSHLEAVSDVRGHVDGVKLVSHLTGKDIARMDYGDYLTIHEAIIRSYTYPFWCQSEETRSAPQV